MIPASPLKRFSQKKHLAFAWILSAASVLILFFPGFAPYPNLRAILYFVTYLVLLGLFVRILLDYRQRRRQKKEGPF